MTDVKEVAKIIVKTANYYQLPVEEVLQWIKDEIVDEDDPNCFHYEVRNNKL